MKIEYANAVNCVFANWDLFAVQSRLQLRVNCTLLRARTGSILIVDDSQYEEMIQQVISFHFNSFAAILHNRCLCSLLKGLFLSLALTRSLHHFGPLYFSIIHYSKLVAYYYSFDVAQTAVWHRKHLIPPVARAPNRRKGQRGEKENTSNSTINKWFVCVSVYILSIHFAIKSCAHARTHTQEKTEKQPFTYSLRGFCTVLLRFKTSNSLIIIILKW